MLSYFALVGTRTHTGSECQSSDGSSAPSGELCVFTSWCGDSSDEKQGKSQWAPS